MDERSPLYTGRILRPDGAPVSEKRLSLDLHTGHRRPPQTQVITDSEGRFLLYREGPVPSRISVWVALLGFHHDHKGEAPVPSLAAEGVYDLGDIVVAKQPVIVAGRVSLPDGSPAPWFEMEWAREPGTSKKEIALTKLRQMNQQMKMGAGPGQLAALGCIPAGRVTTAKDGTFRVLGAVTKQTILLGTKSRFSRDSDTYLLPRNVSALSGREDLELTLIKAAQIKGTLVNGSYRRSEVVVEYSDGLKFRLNCTPGPESEISHYALFLGYVDLTVLDAKTGKLLASIPSLLLVPGEQTDARLRGLILE